MTKPTPTDTTKADSNDKAREWVLFNTLSGWRVSTDPDFGEIIVVEKSELVKVCEENTNLSVKIQRTVDAAYHALLEMSAWMGIPEKKRHSQIEEFMSNVKFCAEHDCRHMDESQRNNELKRERDEARAEVEQLKKAWLDADNDCRNMNELNEKLEAEVERVNKECDRIALEFVALTKEKSTIQSALNRKTGQLEKAKDALFMIAKWNQGENENIVSTKSKRIADDVLADLDAKATE